MKIHFIISTLGGGGAERVLKLMSESLSENELFDVSVITLLDNKNDFNLKTNVTIIDLKKVKYLPGHTLRSIFNLLRYYKYKSNRPDLIISFITLTNLICIITAKIYKIKIIAQEHNSYLRSMKGRKLISDFTKKYIYKWADVVTVLTAFDISFYKKNNVNVQIMPNPCSFEAITDNSHNRKNTILAAGNLDRYHHKGFDNLIELVAPILKKNPEWNLIIAGSGEVGLKYLKSIASRNQVTNQIEFIGFVSNISDYMYNASIYILPSRYEGLPMVLLEAMSQGMACIAYDCKTGPSDIIDNNYNGLLIEDQNKIEMIEGLKILIQNENLRQKLSNNAIRSLERYDIKKITLQYENLIKEILEQK